MRDHLKDRHGLQHVIAGLLGGHWLNREVLVGDRLREVGLGNLVPHVTCTTQHCINEPPLQKAKQSDRIERTRCNAIAQALAAMVLVRLPMHAAICAVYHVRHGDFSWFVSSGKGGSPVGGR